MKIEKVILREIRMRLKAPFETSFGVIEDRRILLVEVIADGVSGWGEITTMESPSYNSETTDTAWHIVSDFIAPAVVGRNLYGASDVSEVLIGIRGHYMAKAGVENALWDIEAQQKRIPLWKLLGGTREEIACGVSLGIRENAESLVNKVEQEVACGYRRIKLKIKPGKDLEFVAAVRKQFPNIQLSVDANSAYSMEDIDHLRKLDQFELLMIEQPLGWDDIYSHARLQAQIRTAICLDECINNQRDAAMAIELGACRIINIKLGRVGGHTGARRVHDVCFERGVPVWCGGMLESGLGRVHNIAMSTLQGFTLPGDVSASSRYWSEDIIEPEVQVSRHGTICASARPGLGYTVNRELVERLSVRSRNWTDGVRVTA
jgi:o-succinylbenzoate synthase